MKYQPLNPELFKLNRSRFASMMLNNAIAIFQSNDMMPRNGDLFYPFRQNSDFFYLSGIDQEESVLVLFPNCPKEGFEEVLFLKETNEHIAVWEGHKYTKEEARKTSGIQKVYWLSEMDSILNEMILLARRIFVNSNENDRFSSDVPSRDIRKAAELKAKYPAHKYHRSQAILKKLAPIKSKYEVEVIQQAIDITNKTFGKVLKFVKPGVYEYEIEAEIIAEFLRNRATDHAYYPIIASGKNACVLHYVENNKACKDGDVILMDFGCEYGNYASDLSRSIPVNGRFSKRQKEVYNAVLRVMDLAKQMLVPGNTLTEYHKEVGLIMEKELLALKLISKADIKNQDPDWPAYKKYFMHGTSHHMGLDVHDLANRYDPFMSGNVFTCEPGIYIPEENLGIRLENDILITDGGPVDLMADIPILADEIEDLMNS